MGYNIEECSGGLATPLRGQSTFFRKAIIMRKYTPDTLTLSLFDGKVCSRCSIYKPFSDYYFTPRDGYIAKCKVCQNNITRATHRIKYAEIKANAPKKTTWRDGFKTCTICKENLSIDKFYMMNTSYGLVPRESCKVCFLAKSSSIACAKRQAQLALNPPRVILDGHKICGHCKQELPRIDFPKESRSPDKHKTICRECINYRCRTKYYSTAKASAYRSRHKDKIRMWKANRYYRLRAGGVGVKLNQWKAILEFYNHVCLCCGRTGRITIDHIMPISLGGKHDVTNVQPLCWSCNSRKNAKFIDYRKGNIYTEAITQIVITI